MTRIYICDSDKSWQKKAVSIIDAFASSQNEEILVRCFDSPDEIIRSRDPAPDVLFTDIEFDKTPSGIDAVKEINHIYPECHVIYLTDRLDYALDVYQTDHMWYVLKSQFDGRLPEIYSRSNQLYEADKSYLVVKTTDGVTARIPCRDIMYLERKDRKTFIYTYQNKYQVRERIPAILDKLPPERFSRCHNSFAVNLDKIREIHTGGLRMRNGTELVISRGYGKKFRSDYQNWAQRKLVK